jgi:hypothetical protein
MSRADVEIVREVMSLFDDARNGDLSNLELQMTRLRDLVTDDAEIDMSKRVFNPQVYRGVERLAPPSPLRSVLTESQRGIRSPGKLM